MEIEKGLESSSGPGAKCLFLYNAVSLKNKIKRQKSTSKCIF